MMECDFCGCELEDVEPYCDDCVEMLNASYEDMEDDWPEYQQEEV